MAAGNETPKAGQKPELSLRQHQILELLQAGMANKEVARELDIGLGTVKQHIVALFKKLNVSNRTMAVSQGIEPLRRQESTASSSLLSAPGLLENRPCVVLSLALPDAASQTAVRLMYGILADVASINDAVFLARKGNAGDVIFGIQRVSEYDVMVALQTACGIYADMLEFDRHIASRLRGCLSAGLAFVSMKRFGGWTGEAIASAAIAFARETLSETLPGNVVFDAVTRDLFHAFGTTGQQVVGPVMSFCQLTNLQRRGARQSYRLVGRDAELTRFDLAMTLADRGQGTLVHLEGEMGMGKSRLCDEFSARCQGGRGGTFFYRCIPPILGNGFFNIANGASCSVADIVALLRRSPDRSPELIIIDDFHILTPEQQILLSTAAADAVGQGKLVVFSGRCWGSRSPAAETIHLRRMSDRDVKTLVRSVLDKGPAAERPEKVMDISSKAAGVPLFAVELARHYDPQSVAFPLLVAISSRMDSLHLDRRLLRTVANNSDRTGMTELAMTWGEDPAFLKQQAERAVNAGVLSWGPNASLTFAHPLLRRAITVLAAE